MGTGPKPLVSKRPNGIPGTGAADKERNYESTTTQPVSGQNEGMALKVPGRLAANCRRTPERAAWLNRLPEAVRNLERRWSVTLGAPFDDEEVSCAWVAPVVRADGTSAVLKLGMPHMESEHEIQGLRFWSGDPTVRLLEADDELGAMLLERCEPGTKLRLLPEPEQDLLITRLSASALAHAPSTARLSPAIRYDRALE